jgi:hypothetical protein
MVKVRHFIDKVKGCLGVFFAFFGPAKITPQKAALGKAYPPKGGIKNGAISGAIPCNTLLAPISNPGGLSDPAKAGQAGAATRKAATGSDRPSAGWPVRPLGGAVPMARQRLRQAPKKCPQQVGGC